MIFDTKVYEQDSPTTLIATTEQAFARGWRDEFNDVGSGTVTLHPNEPALLANPNLIDYGNIVRCVLNGTEVFGWIVESRQYSPAPAGEEAERLWVLSGRGVLALLEDAIVYPERADSSPNDRSFGWMAMAYDDNPWDNAVQIQRQNDNAGTVTPHWVHYPQDWPDPLAYWIWSSAAAGSAPFMAVGKSYFRTHFTLADDTIVGIFAACDDGMRFFLDDELIFDDSTADVSSFGFHNTQREDRVLKAGYHVIAVEAVNMDWTPSSNYAGLLCSVIELDPGHGFTKPMNVIVRSGAAWKAMDYPAVPPGMTVGQILDILLSEAQARGALTAVSLGFTDTEDSASASWPDDVVIAWPIGTSYLDVVRTLVEQRIDVHMSPALELGAWIKGTYGTDLTGSVTLAVGQDFESLSSDGQGHRTNVTLLRNQTGTLSEETSATSLASHRRKENYIEVGTAADATQATVASDAAFNRFAIPSAQLTAKVLESTGPYTVYKAGDTITVPGSITDGPMPVLALTVSENPDTGRAEYVIEGMQDDNTEGS